MLGGCSSLPVESMVEHLRRLLPSPETVRGNRWLRWLGPALHHPRLWHMSRRGIALGVAVGLFFGFLIPIAQIPLSAGAAVLLRANVPTAIASTLVTNPLTFGPVYVAAWKVGSTVLGVRATAPPVVSDAPDADVTWWQAARTRLAAVGKPLIVGLVIFAVFGGAGAYLLVTWAWWPRTRWRRRRGLARRASRASD